MSRRTTRELFDQYQVEVELADRLRASTKEERRLGMYSHAYNELYSRVPNHPGLTRQRSDTELQARIAEQLRSIHRYITPSVTFLEVGAGDCQLALEMAKRVRRVIVIEVSEEKALKRLLAPSNFESVISDGVGIGYSEANSVDVAFSNQVIEHLHPDDAFEQIKELHNVLKPGGVLVLRTPHRFMGPSDVSRHFSNVPKGMHLKEYTNAELFMHLRDVGFRSVRKVVSIRSIRSEWRPETIAVLESCASIIPFSVRRAIVSLPLIKQLFRIEIVAKK